VLIGAQPSLTVDEVVSALEETGVPVLDPRSHAEVPRRDVAAALSSVLGRPIPLLPPIATAPPAAPPVLSAPASPAVALPLRAIVFGTVMLGRTARRTLVLRNAGTGYLTVRVDRPAAPLGAAPARLVVAPGGRATLAVTFRPARAGAYRGSLRLRTDDPRAAVVTIPVRATAVRR
jgi:ASPM-SPD-2-Hydin domain-containing protein